MTRTVKAEARVGPRSAPGPWLVRLTMTLAAWPVAWLVIVALLSAFGDQLGSLPLALRALVISGVLIALMANLVMPLLGRVAESWLTRRL